MSLTIFAIVAVSNAVFWLVFLYRRSSKVIADASADFKLDQELLKSISESLGVLVEAEEKRAVEVERLRLRRIEGKKIAAECRNQKPRPIPERVMPEEGYIPGLYGPIAPGKLPPRKLSQP